MFKKIIKRFLREESGQGMTEYAIIVALLVVAVIAALIIVSNAIKNKFNFIGNTLNKN